MGRLLNLDLSDLGAKICGCLNFAKFNPPVVEVGVAEVVEEWKSKDKKRK